MAKDDYFVIVYKILSYLYQRLKKGEEVNEKMLMLDGPLFKINEKYWAYIIYHIAESNFIEGVSFISLDGLDTPYPASMADCRITPEGIAYLTENSFMKKVKAFLKDVKDIVVPLN